MAIPHYPDTHSGKSPLPGKVERALLRVLTAAAAMLATAAMPALASEWHGVGPDPAEKVVAAVEEPCRDLSLAELGIFRYTCNSARLRAQEIENWQVVLRAAYYIGGGDVHSPATNKLFNDYNENHRFKEGAFTNRAQ